MQFDNPDAPNYDWRKDREWFNQRLANARIRNGELEQEIARLRAQLRQISAVEDTPHTGAKAKVGIMAALARQVLT
jgi:Tfp pilus assembly protein PilN